MSEKTGLQTLKLIQKRIWWFPKIRRTLFGDPHKKDYSILVFILGSPYFGKLPKFKAWRLGLQRPGVRGVTSRVQHVESARLAPKLASCSTLHKGMRFP